MRYTYVRQHDTTDCAAACLAMVCLHYKKEVTITRLRDMMGTDLKGTNLVGLQKAANELGFTTAAVRVDRENFLSDFSLPCIAQVITDQGLAHFVVVFKKTTIKDDGARRKHMLQDAETRKEEEEKGKKHKCKDYVIIGDPGTELKKISLDEFYKNFTGVLLLLNPTSEFKGGKIEKGGMMKRYINLLLPQKKLFFYAILSSIITTILGIASSMFNKILMDEVLPYGLNSLLVTLILVFSVVSITSTLIGFVRQWVLIHLSIKIDIPLMLGYFGHIFNLPMKFFATRKTGDITTRYSDANTIKSIFTSIALSLVMDISMAVITGIILFRMNAMLFSISLFMALVSILLVLVYKQPYKKINEESMAQSAALNSQMIESLRGIETVKCNANEQTELDNLEREYMKSLKISLRSSRISTTQGLISSFISTGFSMLTTYVGITQVLNGEMTLGGFMAFSTLSGYFTSPLSNLIGLQMQIQEASISMKRLTEIMDYESEQDETREYTEMEKIDGDIEFKDVTFRYGNRTPALNHISFTIPQGSFVSLVGESGCGKSTVTAVFAAHGVPLADADQLSREILLPGSPLLPQLAARFGGEILRPDGTLDRRLLADRAFATPEGKAALDSLTHPAIVARIRAAKRAAQTAGAPLFVLDGAVIVGTAAQAECDRLCVVTAPFETSVARIVARDGISPEMAARRLNAQTPERTLTAQADYTLHNDAGLEALQAAAARLCERLQAEGGVTAAL